SSPAFGGSPSRITLPAGLLSAALWLAARAVACALGAATSSCGVTYLTRAEVPLVGPKQLARRPSLASCQIVRAAGLPQGKTIEGSAADRKPNRCSGGCRPAARSDPLLDRSRMAGDDGPRSRKQSSSALGPGAHHSALSTNWIA